MYYLTIAGIEFLKEARGDILRKNVVTPGILQTANMMAPRDRTKIPGKKTTAALMKRRDTLQSFGLHTGPIRGSAKAKEAATELRGVRDLRKALDQS